MTQNEKIKITISAKDKASKVLGGIQKNIVGIGIAYLGWSAISGAITSIIDKTVFHEKVITDLNAALRRHGFEVDDVGAKIEKFADAMQTMTGISDETIITATQSFIDFGNDAKTSMELVKVSMDLAAGGGMNLVSAVDLVGKASVGYTGTLSRYGIIIDESIPKTEKFAAALEQINARFGGAAQARVDTMAVKMKLLSEVWGDFQEKIGDLVLPAFISSLSSVIKVIENLSSILSGKFLESLQSATYATESEWQETKTLRVELESLLKQYRDGAIDIESFKDALSNVTKGDINKDTITPLELYQRAMQELSLEIEKHDFGSEKFIEVGEQIRQLQAATSPWIIQQEESARLAKMNADALEQERKALAKLQEIADTLTKTTIQIAPPVLIGSDDELELDLGFDDEDLEQSTEILNKLLDKYRIHIDTLKGIESQRFEASLIGLSDYDEQRSRIEREFAELRKQLSEDSMLTDQQMYQAKIALAANEAEAIREIQESQFISNQELVSFIDGSMSQLSSGLVDSMLDARSSLRDIFEGIGQDFLKLVVQKSLMAMASSFIPGLGGLFGGGFGSKLAIAGGSSDVFQQGGSQAFKSSVTNNYYQGVVTEDFIATEVVPSVGLASKRNEVELYSTQDNSLGGSHVFS